MPLEQAPFAMREAHYRYREATENSENRESWKKTMAAQRTALNPSINQ